MIQVQILKEAVFISLCSNAIREGINLLEGNSKSDKVL